LIAAVHRLRPAGFLGSEVVVGSREHQYAGTYDVLVRDHAGRRIRLDLKTSSGVFESHHVQIQGYEMAARECGEEPADHLVIVRLAADGSYEFVRSQATPEDFLSLLAAYRAVKRLREAIGDA
jgi:hypothetical protein